MLEKLTLRGPRIAVVDVEEHNTTGLLLPDNAKRNYVFGRVVTLGDNIVLDALRRPVVQPHYLELGDVVIFQANPMMIVNCRYDVDGHKFMVVLQSEPMAKLTNGLAELTIDSFEPLGQWILCKIHVYDMVGGIHIPEAHQQSSPKKPSFTLTKAGAHSGITYPAGTELIIERSRATAIVIGGTRYVYLSCEHVYGSVEGSELAAR